MKKSCSPVQNIDPQFIERIDTNKTQNVLFQPKSCNFMVNLWEEAKLIICGVEWEKPCESTLTVIMNKLY